MPEKIYIICSSGSHEKLQMAAMVTALSAASGNKVAVFFSMNAILYFVKGNNDQPYGEGEFARLLAQEGVPLFRDLFIQAVELGDVELLPCSMALDLMKMTDKDLQSEFGPSTGLTKFLNDAQDGQLLSF